MQYVQAESRIAYRVPPVKNRRKWEYWVLRFFYDHTWKLLSWFSPDRNARSLKCSVSDELGIETSIARMGDVLEE